MILECQPRASVSNLCPKTSKDSAQISDVSIHPSMHYGLDSLSLWNIFGSPLARNLHLWLGHTHKWNQVFAYLRIAWSTPNANATATRRRKWGSQSPTYATSLRRDASFLCCAAYIFDRSLSRCATILHKITLTFSLSSARQNMKLGLSNRFHRNVAPHSHNFSCGNNTCTDRTCCDD